MEVERVQSIASISKLANTIPSEYIPSENEQPAASTLDGVVLEVPVINLSDDSGDEKMAGLISEASRDWGIFHGIPDQVIAKLQEVGKQFFEMPKEEKELIAKTHNSGIEGYGTTRRKKLKAKRVGLIICFIKYGQFLPSTTTFGPKTHLLTANEEYARRLLEVSEKLMKWLSLGLGLEEQELEVGIGGEDTIFLMKINYYPPCPRLAIALGVVAHTDMSALTILVPNEVQGLQVFRDDHSIFRKPSSYTLETRLRY